MSHLQAFYTHEHKIDVAWYSAVNGRIVHAIFADIYAVREMLPLLVARQIEAQLTVNDMISP